MIQYHLSVRMYLNKIKNISDDRKEERYFVEHVSLVANDKAFTACRENIDVCNAVFSRFLSQGPEKSCMALLPFYLLTVALILRWN